MVAHIQSKKSSASPFDSTQQLHLHKMSGDICLDLVLPPSGQYLGVGVVLMFLDTCVHGVYLRFAGHRVIFVRVKTFQHRIDLSSTNMCIIEVFKERFVGYLIDSLPLLFRQLAIPHCNGYLMSSHSYVLSAQLTLTSLGVLVFLFSHLFRAFFDAERVMRICIHIS